MAGSRSANQTKTFLTAKDQGMLPWQPNFGINRAKITQKWQQVSRCERDTPRGSTSANVVMGVIIIYHKIGSVVVMGKLV